MEIVAGGVRRGEVDVGAENPPLLPIDQTALERIRQIEIGRSGGALRGHELREGAEDRRPGDGRGEWILDRLAVLVADLVRVRLPGRDRDREREAVDGLEIDGVGTSRHRRELDELIDEGESGWIGRLGADGERRSLITVEGGGGGRRGDERDVDFPPGAGPEVDVLRAHDRAVAGAAILQRHARHNPAGNRGLHVCGRRSGTPVNREKCASIGISRPSRGERDGFDRPRRRDDRHGRRRVPAPRIIDHDRVNNGRVAPDRIIDRSQHGMPRGLHARVRLGERHARDTRVAVGGRDRGNRGAGHAPLRHHEEIDPHPGEPGIVRHMDRRIRRHLVARCDIVGRDSTDETELVVQIPVGGGVGREIGPHRIDRILGRIEAGVVDEIKRHRRQKGTIFERLDAETRSAAARRARESPPSQRPTGRGIPDHAHLRPP